MTLRVAVQMDPLESIKIAGDSSFALIEAAQARGHSVFEYGVQSLAYESGRLTAWAAPVTVQRVQDDHFAREDFRSIDLVKDVDVVLMRQDPPFDLSYITATHLLERLEGQTLVVNDPASVRNAPEKVFVLDYARFMPPTLIARRIEDVREFHARHPGDLVMKPLHGNGGKAVVRIPADGSNLSALIELFDNAWVEPHMFQPFLSEISEGDKRIVLIDGEIAGAINRRPGAGEFRSNLAQGGSAEATTLTARELKARGLVFVGIDVIGGKWLTEINVTSPTGIMAIDRFNGTNTPAKIWDAIERRLGRS
jgi:glutathione synthase